MTRRKVILPYWIASKEDVSNKEALKNKFGDLYEGELFINNNAEGPYLTILDSNNNLSTFDSSKVSDAKISESFESATTFAVSAITEAKNEIINSVSLSVFEKGGGDNSAVLRGVNCEAKNKAEVAIGAYNKSNISEELSGKTRFSIGIGTEDERKNAFEVRENGDIYIEGFNTSLQQNLNEVLNNSIPYNEGSGITIENKTIHVNIDKDSFLNVNEENELTVTGVTLDAAVTSKDITIEGGQWATAVKTVFTGGTVPAGTTWQSFLESMLCVEKFDTSYSMNKTFTVTCGTLGNGILGATNGSLVEVGTKVSLKSFNANPTTASQSYTVSTFDYGYKLGEDGTYINSTSFTEALTPSLKSSNDALTATFTTFVDESGNTIAKISQNTSMPQVNMRVMDGTNKVVIAQTGDTYTSSSAVTAGTIYVATNLKNYYKDDKITPNTYEPKVTPEDKTATASTTYTVTGYRNTFYGTTSETDTADAAFIRTLTKSNKAIAAGNTISFETNSSDGHLRMVIASPRTIKTVKNQTGTQDLTALLVGTKQTVNVGGVDNFAPIPYNVYDYTWKGAFGNETWIITFA